MLLRSSMMLIAIGIAFAVVGNARAQENYEIQVYGSETMPPGRTMVEVHSNFTIDGRRQLEDRQLPTNHAFHETLEITYGFTPWSEVGFYVFTAIQSDHSWQFVGSHIRPRVRAPENWHWPVGASLSAEAGYQRAGFSPDSWGIELRPIIDRQLGRWYASFNPTFDRAIRTRGVNRGTEFSPNAALTFDATPRVNVGLEYYTALGPVRRFDATSAQQHQLFGVTNLNVGPDWEVNFGYGIALTRAGDRRLVKLILGRRYGNGR